MVGRSLTEADIAVLGELPGITDEAHWALFTAVKAHAWAQRAKSHASKSVDRLGVDSPLDPPLDSPLADPPLDPPPPPPQPLPPPQPPGAGVSRTPLGQLRAAGPAAGGNPMDAMRQQILFGVALRPTRAADRGGDGDGGGGSGDSMDGILAAIASGQARQGLRKVGAPGCGAGGARKPTPANPLMAELDARLAKIRKHMSEAHEGAKEDDHVDDWY